MKTQIGGLEHDAALAQCAQIRARIAPAAAITLAEYGQRLERARALMRDAGVDALLVSAGASLRYFTGVPWGATERLVGLVITAVGAPVVICPVFEEGSLDAVLKIPVQKRLWEEHEDPYAIVAATLALARRQLDTTHGAFPDARFLIVGYGSLGGEEPGFGSDLDLVFLYDAPPDAQSPGPRPLDAHRWHTRLAQKLIALLGSVTGAGRLYETDMRLRPDGSKAILVSTLTQYADYQRERAWTWEHQALVRARAIAGDAALADEFEAIRHTVLSRPRERQSVMQEVADMRLKMRHELDRSTPEIFDLKQGEGGLIDLEFILQTLVLNHASQHPELLVPRASAGLLAAMQAAGLMTEPTCAALMDAHTLLLSLGLTCTLDRRQRQAPYGPDLDRARNAVSAAWKQYLHADAGIVRS